jgi:putative oxidoreductase
MALGAGMAAHGAQKAFGTFGGPGPQAAATMMNGLGFVPGSRYATAAAWTELVSGGLIVLGAGGPIGPAALISTMVVAQASVHIQNGFFAQKNGIELGTLYAAGALAIASSGYGRISLDEALSWKRLREPWLSTACVIGGLAVASAILATRSAPSVEVHVEPEPADEPNIAGAGSAAT